MALVGIAVLAATAAFWGLHGRSIPVDATAGPGDRIERGRPVSAARSRLTPAEALEAGRWPGLPDLDSADSTTPVIPTPDPAAAISPDAIEIDPQLLNGSYAGLVEAFETLPDEPQRASVALAIGYRLLDCLSYQPLDPEDLEVEAVNEFQQQVEMSERLIALQGPDAAKRSISELASIDRQQWIARWISEKNQLRERCEGVDQVSGGQPMSGAATWWRQAADLGSLEGLNNWVGMAFHDVGYSSGNAARLAKTRVRVVDAIHHLLAERYAPVMMHLMMYSASGHFATPSQSRAWIYGEAYRRIVALGPVSGWRWGSQRLAANESGFVTELGRIADQMDPDARRVAEEWVQAIVSSGRQ